MSRIWFAGDLETVATFWRVIRRDGVTLGFTTHDNDLWSGGVLHRAAPGMVPSAIRRSADLEPDSAEVEGALSHDSISPADLSSGRFDGARVVIGLVDWQTGETQPLYRGTIGTVSGEAGGFVAELQSRKAELFIDPVPRTAPSCRAAFCGPGCSLSGARYTHEAVVTERNVAANTVTFIAGAAPANFVGGVLRWFDGPHAGTSMGIVAVAGSALLLDIPIDPALTAGMRASLREGCDRTLDTCAVRFNNAVNFQGEPFLPGNDHVARYPSAS
jgi:uncharacterized phage protein (TIGR02218 family)